MELEMAKNGYIGPKWCEEITVEPGYQTPSMDVRIGAGRDDFPLIGVLWSEPIAYEHVTRTKWVRFDKKPDMRALHREAALVLWGRYDENKKGREDIDAIHRPEA